MKRAAQRRYSPCLCNRADAAYAHVAVPHAVTKLARARRQPPGLLAAGAGNRVAPSTPTMSRDDYEMWCRMFAGTTIRELCHMRDVPRASMRLGVHPPIVHRRATPRTTARLPLRELEVATRGSART